MYPEIVPTRLSKADFAIRRAHKSALEERHERAQILKFPDCQLLEYLLRAHVFSRNMIQSSYDLHAGCPGFRSGGFLYAALFRGIHRFHLGSLHGVQERVNVANEFHVPQSFRLATAIAPRRREKFARRQFRPLGKTIASLCIAHFSRNL